MHPYTALPPTSYWRKSVSGVAPKEIDPLLDCPLQIGATAKVATAGSCFSQRIAKHLQNSGYNYFRTESAPANDGGNPFYGLFSAAYGNIYTTTQLRQLMLRAYGLLEPAIGVWRTDAGRYLDPFRPGLREAGFETAQEVLDLQERHLACVRRMFEEADVFVFTLGLTETWLGGDDIAIPIVPGAMGASAHGADYRFVNLPVAQVTADLLRFIDDLRSLNRRIEIILSVSPVPMIATFENRHVVVSNMYSKSVLRVAADEAVRARAGHVHYFPSYEIIVGHQSRSMFYNDELREVSADGVRHVMASFTRHFLEPIGASSSPPPAAESEVKAQPAKPGRQPVHFASSALEQIIKEYEQVSAVVCDEERLVAAAA